MSPDEARLQALERRLEEALRRIADLERELARERQAASQINRGT